MSEFIGSGHEFFIHSFQTRPDTYGAHQNCIVRHNDQENLGNKHDLAVTCQTVNVLYDSSTLLVLANSSRLEKIDYKCRSCPTYWIDFVGLLRQTLV